MSTGVKANTEKTKHKEQGGGVCTLTILWHDTSVLKCESETDEQEVKCFGSYFYFIFLQTLSCREEHGLSSMQKKAC